MLKGTRRKAALLAGIGFMVVAVAVALGRGADSHRADLDASPVSGSKHDTSASSTPTSTTAPEVVAATGGAPATTTTSWVGHVVSMPDWFTVTVDKPCLHAADTLGFTVQGGMPGQLLIYDTGYADRTSEVTNHYGSGSGNDKFDRDGSYRTTFVLAPNVPPGEAWLHVASAKGGDLIQARTSFIIKPATEQCP